MKAQRIVLLLLALTTGGALAQEQTDLYRPGEPEVLDGASVRARNAAQADARALAAFRDTYQRAGRPAFLMMWHRELSDNIDSGREVSATTVGSGERARDNFERTVKVQWKNGSERAVSLLAPSRAAEFEVGFQQTLRNAGAVLVDRNTAIRMSVLQQVKGGARESALNFQTVEAGALSAYAKYFIEVRFLSHQAASQGGAPRITVLDSSSGAIVADLMGNESSSDSQRTWKASERGFESGRASGEATDWVADSHGFSRQARARTMKDEGRLAAEALMKVLADSLP